MKTLYVKRSDAYSRQFQIETKIVEESGRKYVIKTALNPLALDHLKAMVTDKAELHEYYSNISIANVWENDGAIWSEFIEGFPLSKKFFEAEKNRDSAYFINCVDEYVSIIKGNDKNQTTFDNSDSFIKIFGDGSFLLGAPAVKFCPFEITCNNLMIHDGEIIFIDYEWCYNFPVPTDFLLYRCIKHLYSLSEGFEQLAPAHDIYEHLGMENNPELFDRFWKQYCTYIFDDSSNATIIGHYASERINYLSVLDNLNNELNNKNSYIESYTDEINKKLNIKDEYICKLKTEISEKSSYINDLELRMLEGFQAKDAYIKELETHMETGFSEKDAYIHELETHMQDGFKAKDSYIKELEVRIEKGFSEKDAYIRELETRISEGFEAKDAYISELEMRMETGFSEKDAYINTLENRMDEGFNEKDSYISELEARLKKGFSEKDLYIHELESNMATGFKEKDSYIDELESRMKKGFLEKEVYIAELENRMAEGFSQKEAYINELENRMTKGFDEKDQYINDIKEQMTDGFSKKDQYIHELEDTLDTCNKELKEKEK